MTLITSFIELFRFVKRFRERQEARIERERAERRAEREHQLQLIETIFARTSDAQTQNAAALIALAQAQQSSSDVMKQWLDGFRIADPTPTPPQVVRPEEEWLREQMRLQQLGVPADFELAPEFRLAFELAQGGFNQDQDVEPEREG